MAHAQAFARRRLSALVSKDLIFDKSDIMVGWLNANRPFFFNITIYLFNITIVTADW